MHENHINDKQFLYDMGETMYHAAVYHDFYGMSFVGEKEFHKEWQEINDFIEAGKYKEAIELAAEPIDYPEVPYEILFYYLKEIPAELMTLFFNSYHIGMYEESSCYLARLTSFFYKISGDYRQIHYQFLSKVNEIKSRFYKTRPLSVLSYALIERGEYEWAVNFYKSFENSPTGSSYLSDEMINEDFTYRDNDYYIKFWANFKKYERPLTLPLVYFHTAYNK